MEKQKQILIVAGEASGDLHAANLVKSIKNILADLTFFGLGGKKLKDEGVDLYFDLTTLAVVGFWEVLKNLMKFRKIFDGLLKKVDKNRPDLAILVDYPGFNLRLARALHKRGIPVIYYISPQVWAWGNSRIEIIKSNVSKMIVFFDFEEKLYKKHGIDAVFVGHPSVDVVKAQFSNKQAFARFGLDPGKMTLAILPGSREKEVKTLLPIMLKAAGIINEYFLGRIQFLILRAPTVNAKLFREACKGCKLPLKMASDMTYDGIALSDFALVCSGTATLETAILGVPMAILYKTSFLTWAYIRAMIKIPYIGLVNVVKARKLFEEFIQFDCRADKIADYVIPILQDKDKISSLKLELLSISHSLGEPGASNRAAHIVVDFLKNLP